MESADLGFVRECRREVEPFRAQGLAVLLDIDVQGAAQVRQKCPDAYSVFLRAPSLEVLEKRLRDRGTETEAAIQRRLAAARQELEHMGKYDEVIINDDLATAVAELRRIVQQQCERKGTCTMT